MATIVDPKSSYQASLPKLLILGAASVFIFFITLSLPHLVSFAAFPLVVAAACYSRPHFLALLAGCSIFVFSILQLFDPQWALTLFPLYLLTCTIALTLGEILLRKIHPAKAILNAGMFLTVVIFLGAGSLIHSKKDEITNMLKTSLMTVQDQIQEKSPQGGTELRDQIQLLIDQADKLVLAVPSHLFISIFLGIWFNFYLILKRHQTFHLPGGYPYSLRDLTDLRLPYWVAYLAVGILSLYVLPQSVVGLGAQEWAQSALYVLGAFFFLQGFGVYLEYLDFLNVRGFIRLLLILITVTLANVVLAGVGLFDLWFNFRKFFKKKGKKL